MEEYLKDFFQDPESYPRTVMLFRDQSQLGHTADIISKYKYNTRTELLNLSFISLGQRLGHQSPETSSWIQFHSLVDSATLQEIFK